MSADSLSKGIKEGICDVLGRKSRFQLIKIFQLEVKPQKLEPRVVVLTEYKMHIIIPKLPVKLEQSIHFLNITSLESSSYSKVVIGKESKSLTLHQMEDDLSDVQQLIYCIADTLIMIFPCLLGVVMGRLSLSPASRMQDLMDRLQELQSRDCVPCGRFSFAYHCMCDYHGLTFFEEIAWDVDTIYMAHSSKDLNLNDFDHLDIRYLLPVISTLMYNDWFTKLTISNMKLSMEAISEVVRVLETNFTLEEIVLASVGLKWESVQRIAASLISNAEISIRSLDVSGNLIEDKGLICLLPVIEKMSYCLTTLNLSRTGVTSKGVNKFASSLTRHRHFYERLKVLDLSENSLKVNDLACFYGFLSDPNSLTHLNLANTDCSLDLVMGCLSTGCIQHLVQLDLSHNVYSSNSRKCAKAALLSWQQFFSGSGALQSVNVAGTKLPAEVLKSILLGLSRRDCQAQSLQLNLGANAFGSAGAEVLQSSISNISCISSLDISDNGFDQNLPKVLLSIAKNRHIKKLSVGKNLMGAKPKHVLQTAKALVQIITDDNLPLECLSIEDLKLKRDAALFLNALCGNSSLTQLDISGNQMGDFGARVLSKVLLVNRKLARINWDHNNITAAGFADIATALQRNRTLKLMPVPVNDVASSLRINQEKTEQAVQQIELLLHRNSGPQKLDSDQSFKLRQVLLVNSTQQVMDQLIVRLQNVISQLELKCLSEETQEEISHALGLIKDASVSRHLLLELQTLSKSLQDPEGPIPHKFNSVAVGLQATMLQKFKALVSDMFKYLEVQCPIVFNSRTADSAKSLTSQLSDLPSDFVRGLIRDHLEIEVYNRLDELNFVVAGVLCNKVMEEVILALDKAHKSLKYALKCESRTDGVSGPTTVRSRPAKSYDSGSVSSSVSDDSTSDSHSESLHCVQLIQKALRARHLRPTSHFGPVPTGHFGSGIEDMEEDGNSGTVTPFKTQSTPALLVPAGQPNDGKSSETDCRPPVPVFRKRKGFAQATSASFEVILDGDSTSRDGALPKFGGDLVRLRKERHSWRTPEAPSRRTEVSCVRRSSDTFLYQTPSPAGRQASFASPNRNTLTVGQPLPGNVKGNHGNGGEASSRSRKSFESSSNQLSLLSAMLATSAASIAMITIQKATSSSSSSLNRSVEQDLSRTSATELTRGADEGGDYSTTESQTAASVTDSDIVIEDDVYASTPFIEDDRPSYSSTPTYYSFFPNPVHLSSELLHPTKDRPKHPKTRSSSRRSVFTCRAFLERGPDEDGGDVLSPGFLSSKGKTASAGAKMEQDTVEMHQAVPPLRSQRPITAPKSPQASSRTEVCAELHNFSWDQGEIGVLPISPRTQNSSCHDSRQQLMKRKACCPSDSLVTEKDDEQKEMLPNKAFIRLERKSREGVLGRDLGKKLEDSDQMFSSKSRLPPTPAPKPSKKSPKKDTFD